jgi:hypothetical protein
MSLIYNKSAGETIIYIAPGDIMKGAWKGMPGNNKGAWKGMPGNNKGAWKGMPGNMIKGVDRSRFIM